VSDSIHQKLTRVRKPRVHITYDVEQDGAVLQKELPFVVGMLGDYSGDPTTPLPPLRERKFVQIDRDNFDDVMARMGPGLKIRVENKIADDDSEFPVELAFRSIEDFEPANIVKQIEPLRRLLETRDHLRDLLSKIDRSEQLETLLEEILQSKDKITALSKELGLAGDDQGQE
jgi:type VI secretion system protein ImpB